MFPSSQPSTQNLQLTHPFHKPQQASMSDQFNQVQNQISFNQNQISNVSNQFNQDPIQNQNVTPKQNQIPFKQIQHQNPTMSKPHKDSNASPKKDSSFSHLLKRILSDSFKKNKNHDHV